MRRRTGELPDGALLLLLLAAAFLLRFPVFFDSVVDRDESLYLLMADDVWRGVLPYRQTFDNKPPGLYYLFTLVDLLGGSIAALRLLGVCLAAVAAFAVHGIARTLFPGRVGPRCAAALLLVLYTTNGGLAVNAELALAPFLLSGVWAALVGAQRGDRRLKLLAGALFACALSVKPQAGFDLVGFAVLYAVFLREPAREPAREPRGTPNRALSRYVRDGTLMLAAFLGSILLLLLPHALAGQWSVVREHAVDFNVTYVREGSTIASPMWLVGAFARYLGVFAVALAASVLPRPPRGAPSSAWDGRESPSDARRGPLIGAVVCWMLVVAAGTVVSKRYYPHYALQIAPPLCILFGVGLERFVGRALRPRLAIALAFAVALAGGALIDLRWPVLRLVRNLAAGDAFRMDMPRAVASRVLANGGPGQSVYVYNSEPIIYHLTEARRPTRYALPDHLLDDYPVEVTGITPESEIERILRTRPDWIVVKEGPATRAHPRDPQLRRHLDRDYVTFYERSVEFHPGETVVLYRRKAD